ncbi:MAG: CsbD family protein [Caulobacteraceae bacterium]
MDQNRIDGALKEGVGRARDAYGGAVGDLGVQARGKVDEVSGAAQNLYGQALDQARDIAGRAGDMVADRPYAALGVAAIAGLAIGLMLRAGDRRVVYIRE